MATENERVPLSTGVSQPSATGAVFLSYASEDAVAAERIATALHNGGIEVWFDRSELRGGDAWDHKIRDQIHDCRLFIPVISANTEARDEGYFRREWALAADRTRDMAHKRTFLVPVAIDGTPERGAAVPDKFLELQWTRLPEGQTPPAFVERMRGLLAPEAPRATPVPGAGSTARPISAPSVQQASLPKAAVWAVGVMAAAALAYLFANRVWFSKHLTVTQPAAPSAIQAAALSPSAQSIAVLPFADMSEKKDQEYFADGLSEEILNLLGSIPNLKVIGRTSSFRFKGRDEDLRSIGEKLGAAYVLEGSVRRAADRVRVTAQLINARDGVHLWSNTYERPFGDVLKLQDELAAGVARALEVTVRSDTLHARGSRNNEAYDLYLRGLHSLDGFNGEGFKTAGNYFQQALDLDPSFGQAAAEFGRVVVLEAEFGYAPPDPTYERARGILETAIRLDPTSALAHAWLGWIHMGYDWNWATATTDMQEALRLTPHDPEVHLCAARLAMALGYWDQAIGLLMGASARDPLEPAMYNSLSETYLRIGRLADAEEAERRVLEISPTYVSAPFNLAKVLLAEGRPADALTLITTRQQNTSDRPTALAIIYQALGHKADSDAQLATLIRQYQGDEALEIADVFAFRGEADEAFRWIERAYRQRDAGLYLIKADPLLKNIEVDSRYKAFLRKMNLPE